MKRIASQICFCRPDSILRRMVIEQDEHHCITRMFGLDDGIVESSNTLFYDGILSTEITSLKIIATANTIENIIEKYNYHDLSISTPINPIVPSSKALFLDFGTSNYSEINKQLKLHAGALCNFSIFEVIAACSYYPALELNIPCEIKTSQCSKITLWKDTDLVCKKLTGSSSVSLMN